MWYDSLRTNRPERIDQEGLSERGLRLMSRLDRWNRLSGWDRFHRRCVQAHWEALGRPRPFRIVDIGAGTGTFLSMLWDWADTSGLPIELTGIELQPAFAERARQRLGSRAEIWTADASQLDVPNDRWDLATCALTLHHLDPALRPRLLAELGRTCRGVYLFDLEFTLYGWMSAHLLYPLIGVDAASDGVLSVRRSCTHDEFASLVDALPVQARRRFPTALYTAPAYV